MMMKLLRRVTCLVAMIMPDTNTDAKHWSTRPPTTQIGIELNAAPSLPKTPIKLLACVLALYRALGGCYRYYLPMKSEMRRATK